MFMTPGLGKQALIVPPPPPRMRDAVDLPAEDDPTRGALDDASLDDGMNGEGEVDAFCVQVPGDKTGQTDMA